jgi:hypothetical protein
MEMHKTKWSLIMQNDQCKKVILTHVDQLLLQDEDVMGLDETLSTAPSPRWG